MYIPTNVHTHYSLLRSLIKPDTLVAKLADRGIPACCLTDFDVLAGSVKFYTECKKKDIKPILGTKVFVVCELGDGKWSTKNNQKFVTSADDFVYTPDVATGYVTLLAQNLEGWKELIRLSSKSYTVDRFVDRPTISLDDVLSLKNCLALLGSQECLLFNSVFGGTPSYTNPIVKYNDFTNQLIDSFQSNFGEKLFFQMERVNDCQASLLAADVLSERARLLKIKTLATPSPFYLESGDKPDHLVVTATKFGCYINELQAETSKIENSVYSQLINKDFSFPDMGDMVTRHTEEEINNTVLLCNMCENYNILGKPKLPQFPTPNGETEEAYLKQLCRDGWKNKIAGKINPDITDDYVKRVLYELGVINEANLSGYFLIVQDYVNWAKSHGWLIGSARGSAAGSLVSYLTDITTIDPIRYKLLFERFYNSGRNSKDNISLPDIDCDFPPEHRYKVADYIRNKYGDDNVGQVITFSRLSGRGALREVLRANLVCTNSEIDEISKRIPQEAEISDRLEEDHETSILRWTLNNEPKTVAKWAAMTDGKVTGDFGAVFEQAIRLEGIYKSYGKHASALVISGESLSETIPLIREKSGEELILGFEYEDAEKMGSAKMDILGLNTLSRLQDVNELLRYGRILNDN